MPLLRWLARRRAYVLLGHLAVAAGFLPGLLELETGNPARLLFPRGAPELAAYERLAAGLGEADAVRVAVAGPGLWTREGLAWLMRLERDGQRLPGARLGAGLVRRWQGPPGAWPPTDPEGFREMAAADRLSRELGWIGADGRAASAILVVGELSSRPLAQFTDGLDELLATAPPGIETRVAGIPVLARALDREVTAFGLVFVPLVLALALALLLAVLRRPAATLPCLALAGFSETVLFGSMGYAGVPVTLVSAFLAPILLVLAVAGGVHIQLRYRWHSRELPTAGDALEATYREKLWPVLGTGLTTLIGFGSAAVSAVPVVRGFGLWAAAGVALVTAASFSLLPALLAAGGAGEVAESPFERAARRWGRRLATSAAGHRGAVLASFAVMAVAAAAGLLRLQPEGGVASFFAAGHPVPVALERMAEMGLAPATAELMIEPATVSGDGTVDWSERPGLAAALAGLAGELRERPEVLTALGAGDLRAPGGGPAGPRLARVVERLLVSADGSLARIVLGIPMLGPAELRQLGVFAEDAARRRFPGGRAALTGRYPLVSAAKGGVFRTLLAALALTLAGVAGVFLLLLRSGRRTLELMAPNLWAVLVALGAMGWLAIPLGGNTVLVGAVVLGLAVDDTLQFFGDFRRRGEGTPATRAAAALERTAGGHLLSSAMLVAGFGVCALAGFRPLADAGALMAIGVGAALAGDLLLLPAMLSRSEERKASGQDPDPGPERGA